VKVSGMYLTDSGVALQRQEAMDAARRRMQDSHSMQAAKFAEEQRKVRS